MEACWAHNPEVRRSKLRSAKIFVDTLGVPLAQRIARWTSNPKVLGSIPRWDDSFFLVQTVNVRMAEWSKAPDSRHCFGPLIESCENSGPRMRAWVQIPLLTNQFFFLIYAIDCSLGVSPINAITRQYFACIDKCNGSSESWISFSEGSVAERSKALV